MAQIVYTLCALTSIGCALLLIRAYRRVKQPLLFWSALCFSGLAINNVLLFLDLLVVRDISLALPRAIVSFSSVGLFVHGLIKQSR